MKDPLELLKSERSSPPCGTTAANDNNKKNKSENNNKNKNKNDSIAALGVWIRSS